jgi:hypothetical protein
MQSEAMRRSGAYDAAPVTMQWGHLPLARDGDEEEGRL